MFSGHASDDESWSFRSAAAAGADTGSDFIQNDTCHLLHLITETCNARRNS